MCTLLSLIGCLTCLVSIACGKTHHQTEASTQISPSNVSLSSNDGIDWLAIVVVIPSSPEGDVAFEIRDVVNVQGLYGSDVAATTDDSSVSIDLQAPVVDAALTSTNEVPHLAKAGDTLLLSLTSNEPICSAYSCGVEIQRRPADVQSVASSNDTFVTSLLVASLDDPEGYVTFRAYNLSDPAGNEAVEVTRTSDGSMVWYDMSAPSAQLNSAVAFTNTRFVLSLDFSEPVLLLAGSSLLSALLLDALSPESVIIASTPPPGHNVTALGMESGDILDGQLNASSSQCPPSSARLNSSSTVGGLGSWCGTSDPDDWLQVDLVHSASVACVATQGRSNETQWVTSVRGRSNETQWVTSYRVSVSADGEAWEYVEAAPGGDLSEEFPGNSDENSVVTNAFAAPREARFVRFHPLQWQGRNSMRVELYSSCAIAQFEVTVDSTADQELTFGVAQDGFRDEAGNLNTPSSTVTVMYDTIHPMATIASSSVEGNYTYSSDASFEFSCTDSAGCVYSTCLVSFAEEEPLTCESTGTPFTTLEGNTTAFRDLPASAFQLTYGECEAISAWDIVDAGVCNMAKDYLRLDSSPSIAGYAVPSLPVALPLACSDCSTSTSHPEASATGVPGERGITSCGSFCACSDLLGRIGGVRLRHRCSFAEWERCVSHEKTVCEGHPGYVSVQLNESLPRHNLTVENWNWPSEYWALHLWAYPVGENSTMTMYWQNGTEVQVLLEARFPRANAWQHITAGSEIGGGFGYYLDGEELGPEYLTEHSVPTSRVNSTLVIAGQAYVTTEQPNPGPGIFVGTMYIMLNKQNASLASLAAAALAECKPSTGEVYGAWLVHTADGVDISGSGYDMKVSAGSVKRGPGNVHYSCPVWHRLEMRAVDLAGNNATAVQTKEFLIVPHAALDKASISLMVWTGLGPDDACEPSYGRECSDSDEFVVSNDGFARLEWTVDIEPPKATWLELVNAAEGGATPQNSHVVRIGGSSESLACCIEHAAVLLVTSNDLLQPVLRVNVTMQIWYVPTFVPDEDDYDLGNDDELVLFQDSDGEMLTINIQEDQVKRHFMIENPGNYSLDWQFCGCRDDKSAHDCCDKSFCRELSFPDYFSFHDSSRRGRVEPQMDANITFTYDVGSLSPNTYEWYFSVHHNGYSGYNFSNVSSACEVLSALTRVETDFTLQIIPTSFPDGDGDITLLGGEWTMEQLYIINVGPSLNYSIEIFYDNSSATREATWMSVAPSEEPMNFADMKQPVLTLSYTVQQPGAPGRLTGRLVITNTHDDRETVVEVEVHAVPGVTNASQSRLSSNLTSSHIEAGGELSTTITTFDLLGNSRAGQASSGRFRGAVRLKSGTWLSTTKGDWTDNYDGTVRVVADIFQIEGEYEYYVWDDVWATDEEFDEENPCGLVTSENETAGCSGQCKGLCIQDSPFLVTVTPSNADAETSVLQALNASVIAGDYTTFVIQARDKYNNPLTTGSNNTFNLMLRLEDQGTEEAESRRVISQNVSQDNGDGTHSISQVVNSSGTYTVYVSSLEDTEQHVVNGAGSVQMNVTYAAADSEVSFVQAVDDSIANETVELHIWCRDAFNNTHLSGDVAFSGRLLGDNASSTSTGAWHAAEADGCIECLQLGKYVLRLPAPSTVGNYSVEVVMDTPEVGERGATIGRSPVNVTVMPAEVDASSSCLLLNVSESTECPESSESAVFSRRVDEAATFTVLALDEFGNRNEEGAAHFTFLVKNESGWNLTSGELKCSSENRALFTFTIQGDLLNQTGWYDIGVYGSNYSTVLRGGMFRLQLYTLYSSIDSLQSRLINPDNRYEAGVSFVVQVQPVDRWGNDLHLMTVAEPARAGEVNASATEDFTFWVLMLDYNSTANLTEVAEALQALSSTELRDMVLTAGIDANGMYSTDVTLTNATVYTPVVVGSDQQKTEDNSWSDLVIEGASYGESTVIITYAPVSSGSSAVGFHRNSTDTQEAGSQMHLQILALDSYGNEVLSQLELFEGRVESLNATWSSTALDGNEYEMYLGVPEHEGSYSVYVWLAGAGQLSGSPVDLTVSAADFDTTTSCLLLAACGDGEQASKCTCNDQAAWNLIDISAGLTAGADTTYRVQTNDRYGNLNSEGSAYLRSCVYKFANFSSSLSSYSVLTATAGEAQWYDFVLKFTAAGSYEMVVHSEAECQADPRGAHGVPMVRNSPLNLTVYASNASVSGSQSRVLGPSERVGEVSNAVNITVQSKDQYGNDVYTPGWEFNMTHLLMTPCDEVLVDAHCPETTLEGTFCCDGSDAVSTRMVHDELGVYRADVNRTISGKYAVTVLAEDGASVTAEDGVEALVVHIDAGEIAARECEVNATSATFAAVDEVVLLIAAKDGFGNSISSQSHNGTFVGAISSEIEQSATGADRRLLRHLEAANDTAEVTMEYHWAIYNGSNEFMMTMPALNYSGVYTVAVWYASHGESTDMADWVEVDAGFDVHVTPDVQDADRSRLDVDQGCDCILTEVHADDSKKTEVALVFYDRFGNRLTTSPGIEVEGAIAKVGSTDDPTKLRWKEDIDDEGNGQYALRFAVETSGQFTLNLTEGSVVTFGSPYVIEAAAIDCNHTGGGNTQPSSDGRCCVCQAGHVSSSSDSTCIDVLTFTSTCEACPVGSYTTSAAQVACQQCEGTKTTLDAGSSSVDACVCQNDYYEGNSGPAGGGERARGDCLECPEGATCEGGSLLKDIIANKGYWRSSRDSAYFLECDRSDTDGKQDWCQGGVESDCIEGHKGPLCNICEDGWSRAVGMSCVKCQHSFDWAIWLGSIVTMGLIVYAFVFLIRQRTNQVRQDIQDKIEIGKKKTSPGVLAKSMLTYMQMMGLVTEVNVEWNPMWKNYLATMDGVSNASIFNLPSFSCTVPLTYWDQYVLYMSLPVLAVLVPGMFIAGLYLKRWLTNPGEVNEARIQRSLAHFSNSVVLLIFLQYTIVIRKAVEVFKCIVVTDGEEETEQSFLAVDMSIDCDSVTYARAHTASLVFCVLYGVGTPALLFAVLFSLRGQLDAHYVRMNLEFTYLGYKKEFWWWECYSLMRKFVISFTMVYYKKDYSMQILLSLASTDIFLVTLVAKQPYSSNLQNWFDIGQLLTIAITLQCSLLFGADDDGSDLETEMVMATVVMLVMNFALVIFFIVAISRRAYEEYGEHLHKLKDKAAIAWENVSPNQWENRERFRAFSYHARRVTNASMQASGGIKRIMPNFTFLLDRRRGVSIWEYLRPKRSSSAKQWSSIVNPLVRMCGKASRSSSYPLTWNGNPLAEALEEGDTDAMTNPGAASSNSLGYSTHRWSNLWIESRSNSLGKPADVKSKSKSWAGFETSLDFEVMLPALRSDERQRPPPCRGAPPRSPAGAGPRGTRTCAILTSGSARSRTDVLARAPKEDQPAAEDTGIPDFWERRESRPPSVGEVPYLPSFHFGLDQEDFWERESTADMRTSEIRSRLTSSNSLIVNDGLVYQDQAEGTVAVPNDQSKASRFQPARYLKALALRAYNAFASRDDSMTGSSSLVRSDHGEGRLAARSDFCKGDVPPASGVTTINPMSTVAGASDWTAAETSQPSTPAISQEPSGLVTEMATISRQEMPGESTPSREAWRTLRAQSAAPEPLTELTKRRSSRVEVLKHEVLKNSVDHGAMLEQGNMQWGLQGLDQSLLTEELGPTAPVEMEGEGLKSSVLLEEPGPAVPIKLEGEGLESQSLSTEDPGPAVPSELKEEELENSLPEEPSPPALESGLVEEKLDTSVSSESPNSLLLGEMEAPSAALHPSPVNVNQSSEAKRRAEYLASRGGVKEVRVSEGDLEHSLGSFEEMK
ncbi:hypothetical protein CYMTET_9456 [Cymbomonas tetramitiformis]|uniref:F5/8 type C domain-containing protein n=1 Tax=Cymbomonas tetramitiformis TaxID=36881 RepID=A0AAE0GR95_9CHLO|nr:hypothetical protein CYMTET_9456 [Cymbomonas tetramitiformis]